MPDQPCLQGEVSIASLIDKVSRYLKKTEIKEIKAAFQFGNAAHTGQYRQSGEPYITHPIAVAEICAGWKLDARAIIAALLHDVIEDQGVTKAELAERFGAEVAELVDGLSKLDKMEFRSREEAQAENFRKMLLAMARDVRVILIKLADRLHNMRTLGAVPAEKRQRVARETIDIYAPIAYRLGLNKTYQELQEACFENEHPHRYATLSKALEVSRHQRQEIIEKILKTTEQALSNAKINFSLSGREKTICSIYKKMRTKHTSFANVLDRYGFRVIVEYTLECYQCIGVLHSLYKPMPGHFKDYIAVPKVNGYQSLHTTVLGPLGTPIEFQVRTRKMHEIAESGVAAHWLYKKGKAELDDMQERAHQWLKSLLDIQSESGDATEFFEHVKADLFPDVVYVFTPKSRIMALPRGATALDFAYAIHSDLGNECVAIRINNELLPLRTPLESGDVVHVITAPYSKPNPTWLGFVRTGKARAAIRHYLKTMHLQESILLGERLLERGLKAYNLALVNINAEVWEKLIQWTGSSSSEVIFADIGLGRQVAAVMAKRIAVLLGGLEQEKTELGASSAAIPHKKESTVANTGSTLPSLPLPVTGISPVGITGTEGMSVQLSTCCRPIPGDDIMGYIGIGLGMAIHTTHCRVAQRIHQRDPERWIDVVWETLAGTAGRLFDASIKVLVYKRKGTIARIAADITAADANIAHIAMDEVDPAHTPHATEVLRLMIQIRDRIHLAQVLRHLRTNKDVLRIAREKPGSDLLGRLE